MFPLRFEDEIRYVQKINRDQFTPYHFVIIESINYDNGKLIFKDKNWASIFLGAGEEKAVYCIYDHENRVFALEIIDQKHYLNGRFVGGEYFFEKNINSLKGIKLNPESLIGLTFTGLVKGREFVNGFEWGWFQFNPNKKSWVDCFLTSILQEIMGLKFNECRTQYKDVHERNVMFEIKNEGKGIPVLLKDAKGKLRIRKIGIQPIDVR